MYSEFSRETKQRHASATRTSAYLMIVLLIIVIIMFATSCKKQTIEPGQPIKTVDNLYNVRLDGGGEIDTAIVLVNGRVITNGYHVVINKGDTLSFAYTATEEMKLALWKDINELPKLIYFPSIKEKRFKKVLHDGRIIYHEVNVLKGRFIPD